MSDVLIVNVGLQQGWSYITWHKEHFKQIWTFQSLLSFQVPVNRVKNSLAYLHQLTVLKILRFSPPPWLQTCQTHGYFVLQPV